MRALVVDDSRAIRTIISRILKELEFEVLEAGHGQEALERLVQSGPVDLMLIDWNMPVMDGFQLLCAVRASTAWTAVPIMMVTTETEMTQMTRALEAGANEYLMKPFTREVLRDKLAILGVIAA